MSSNNSTAQIAGGVAVAGAIAAAAAIAPKLGSLSASAPNQSTAAAASFLNRATFGADAASAQALAANTTDAWFQTQRDAAPSPGGTPGFWTTPANFHLAWVDRRQADFDAQFAADQAAAAADPNAKKPNHRRVDRGQFQEGFWARAVTGDDQLRHRMTLALSEIFVVSFQGSTITPRIAASWYDMLSARAFGSYFDLLKAVTLHPAMGLFLNIIGNTQADNDPTRHPDENYAREIMQLMSIGLVQLNPDGTQRTDAAGAPIPTYTHDDIAGLAKVFTGWGWYAAKPTANTFAKQPGNGVGVAPDVQNLIPYPALHSQLSKTFLGATIPAYTGGAPTTAAGAAALADYQRKSLDTALGVIFAHPNVGPFIGRRLIQRFVTSNPSPAYVSRVAQAFNGDPARPTSRGDLFATLKAVLTDPEAQNRDAALASPTSGRLREPTIRMSHWLRACGAASQPAAGAPVGNFVQFADLGDPGYLAQAPLEAPSVFNFWDPDFTPTGSRIAAAKLVAPEFQAVDALTVASYANLMAQVVENKGWPGGDVKVTYAQEIATLAPTTPGAPDLDSALIDRINTLFFGGTMSPVLQGRLTRVLASTRSAAKTPTADQLAGVRLDKVRSALILTLTAPEYLVQR